MGEIKKDSDGFVMAESLSQFQLRNAFRLWQVVNGKVKCFTNSFPLQLLELGIGFDCDEFIRMLADQQGGQLVNGFYWADHIEKMGSYFPCETWTVELENKLRERGFLFDTEL